MRTPSVSITSCIRGGWEVGVEKGKGMGGRVGGGVRVRV
jgi:hypothetical protein